MKIKVFTLFPEMLRPMLSASILGRAIRKGLIEVDLIDIRDYTLDKHRSTDDYPFGGGAGMVMMAQPIVDAITQNTPEGFSGRRVYLSPRGRTLNQRIVEALAKEDALMLLCGHYEGVDQRALDRMIDEEISIGDYVLTGGELGALVLIDAVARLVPGVLGSDASPEDESFTTGLLEYPQYTRPADFRGDEIPEVLLNGNHAHIQAWRREQSLAITLERRPELLEAAPLTDADRAMLERLKRARALNLPGERLELRLADEFPRRWLNAFVPEERRKEARKQCLSGRRHAGCLWRAFTMGFIPSRTEEWPEGEALLYLPGEELLYRVPAGCVPDAKYYILTDPAFTRTLLRAPDGKEYMF